MTHGNDPAKIEFDVMGIPSYCENGIEYMKGPLWGWQAVGFCTRRGHSDPIAQLNQEGKP